MSEALSALPSWAWVALAALLALALIQTARLAWRDLRQKHVVRARMRRAAAGERAAGPLLERGGYRIEGRQVSRTLEYQLDGEACVVEVRADYLVEREGERFVAEVKTGKEAPRLAHRPTRRQLLEYAHAFDTRGVLLVDAEAGRVHRVAVPGRGEAPRSRVGRDLALVLLGLVLGAAGVWLSLRGLP